MNNTRDVTIVPVHPGPVSREWITVLLVIVAAIAVWILAWRHTGPTATHTGESPAYHVAPTIKELEITYIDVGQGDSIFIRTPNGRIVLVDAGASRSMYSNYDAGEQAVMPFLQSRGIQRIDTLVMTHPHVDHYGGMQYLLNAGITVGEYLDPGMDHPTESYRTLLETVLKMKIPYREVVAPMTLDWDSDMLVQVLWPDAGYKADNPNNASITLRIAYGQVVIVLAGDVEAEVENVLCAYGPALRTTVLKVPHHGSNTSSSRNFLANLTPRLAIISVGRFNKFNHPNPNVLDLYDTLNTPVLRTDISGTIRTVTDGAVMRVTPEFGSPFEIFPFPPKAAAPRTITEKTSARDTGIDGAPGAVPASDTGDDPGDS